MTTARRSGAPLAALRRITRDRPVPAAGERCDLCAAPVAAGHGHVVDLQSRALMCSCRPCYLLFTDEHATLHYRAVPDRYLRFPELDAGAWDDLQIPVGLAFLFRNSVQNRTIAFYPGPAGATESELPLGTDRQAFSPVKGGGGVVGRGAFSPVKGGGGVVGRGAFSPVKGGGGVVGRGIEAHLALVRPDVEALLLRRGECFLVPIDVCYELVGQLRTVWRGFDGGREAHEAIDTFFARVRARSRPVGA